MITKTKTQLDFILNPVEASPLRSSADVLLPKSPSCVSDSPSSVFYWDEKPTMLLHDPRTPALCHNRFAQCLPHLAMSKPYKRIRAVLPPISTSVSSSTVNNCMSATTSFEGKNLGLDSPKEVSLTLSHKKKTHLCKEKGCTSLAVSRRSCVRHGGGSRCTFEGCTNGAKLRNRCFQHGGSTICLTTGCNSKAKRYGYCWSHGGGRICSADGCVKVAAQGGFCWAHGGGNRCKLDNCSKRSYQKYGYYCKAHASYNV